MERWDEHGLVAVVRGTKMRSEGDSGGLLYKSQRLCTNRPLCPHPWAGWAPPYLAIGTIRAPRYPRYPHVKESPERYWRYPQETKIVLCDISMCPYLKSNLILYWYLLIFLYQHWKILQILRKWVWSLFLCFEFKCFQILTRVSWDLFSGASVHFSY